MIITPLPAFNDNYIWLLEHNGQAVVVDPGDAAPVIKALASRGLQLCGILVTHHHFDHVGGIAELLKHAAVPVWGPANPAIETITQALGEGDSVEILGTRFDVMAVPGHTLDHLAYFAPASDESEAPLLFCGDTLFAGGCGRMFEGTPAVMHDSLRRLAALPPATRLYCAHEYTEANIAFARAVEPDNADLQIRESAVKAVRERGEPTVPSEIATERNTNPFLRCHLPAVQAAASSQGLSGGADDSQVFAAIRAWKDNF